MIASKAVSQYLSRHAEPEAAAADRLEGSFGHALVVPAYGEGRSLFDTLGSVPRGPRGDTLVVVTPIPDAFAVTMGNTAYLLRHPRLEPLLDAIRKVQQPRSQANAS